jgi:hydroxymethylpyrimidine/phosphomethylpyrimidine kinase
MSEVPVALTIAGSDSGGGAGIQADLRTFAFHRVHGTSAITCVTAQNTLGVDRVDALPAAAVAAQCQSVVRDIGVHAAKTGMLLNDEIMVAVAEEIDELSIPNLVVDPVMVSRTGARLIDDDAIAVLCESLIPKAAIVTPNHYEAQLLSEWGIDDVEDMKKAAEKIYELGASAVLVKGGGMLKEYWGTDVWFDGDRMKVLKGDRIETKNTHGTGCTLSAAIAANLALGKPLFKAVQAAKDYTTEAIRHSFDLGEGQGPIGHFFGLNQQKSHSPKKHR